MARVPDVAVLQRKLGGFPLVTYQAGESVLTAGLITGRLLILKQGAVTHARRPSSIAEPMVSSMSPGITT